MNKLIIIYVNILKCLIYILQLYQTILMKRNTFFMFIFSEVHRIFSIWLTSFYCCDFFLLISTAVHNLRLILSNRRTLMLLFNLELWDTGVYTFFHVYSSANEHNSMTIVQTHYDVSVQQLSPYVPCI